MEMFIGHSKMIDSICADKIRKTRITEKNSVRNIDTV